MFNLALTTYLSETVYRDIVILIIAVQHDSVRRRHSTVIVSSSSMTVFLMLPSALGVGDFA